jgi:hypothetical protein
MNSDTNPPTKNPLNRRDQPPTISHTPTGGLKTKTPPKIVSHELRLEFDLDMVKSVGSSLTKEDILKAYEAIVWDMIITRIEKGLESKRCPFQRMVLLGSILKSDGKFRAR